MDLEKKLKRWLEDSSIHTVLQWFDTVEGVRVSSKLAKKRWTTEITQRDRLFLDVTGSSSINWVLASSFDLCAYYQTFRIPAKNIYTHRVNRANQAKSGKPGKRKSAETMLDGSVCA
jgi:hypothetical protein